MMEEAHLSIKLRKDISTRMFDGSPILLKKPLLSKRNHDENLFNLKKNYHFSKRTQQQIADSGAYMPETIWLPTPAVDRQQEKEDLQNIMTYGKRCDTGKLKKREVREQPVVLTKDMRMEELKREIEERLTFLHEMKELKQEKKYIFSIKQEIAAKLREIKKLEQLTNAQFLAKYSRITQETV